MRCEARDSIDSRVRAATRSSGPCPASPSSHPSCQIVAIDPASSARAGRNLIRFRGAKDGPLVGAVHLSAASVSPSTTNWTCQRFGADRYRSSPTQDMRPIGSRRRHSTRCCRTSSLTSADQPPRRSFATAPQNCVIRLRDSTSTRSSSPWIIFARSRNDVLGLKRPAP
jgi:hypothetical protein